MEATPVLPYSGIGISLKGLSPLPAVLFIAPAGFMRGNVGRPTRLKRKIFNGFKPSMGPLSSARFDGIDREFGGGGRIRTSVLIRGQIYSLLPLTTRPPLHAERPEHRPGRREDCAS